MEKTNPLQKSSLLKVDYFTEQEQDVMLNETFSEVDILDGTPLLDIKPYVSHFDSREDVRNGWLEKHFKNGKIPKRTKLE